MKVPGFRPWAAVHVGCIALQLLFASIALTCLAYGATYNAAAATRENESNLAYLLAVGAFYFLLQYGTPPGIFLYCRLNTGVWFSPTYLRICSILDITGFGDAAVFLPAAPEKAKKKKKKPAVIEPQPLPFKTPFRPRDWRRRGVNVMKGELMPKPVRFHFDENIRGALAEKFRRHGLDVTTTAEAGLTGAPDPIQLAYARDTGRCLVTHDMDFLALHEEGAVHADIIHMRVGKIWEAEALRIALRMVGKIAEA